MSSFWRWTFAWWPLSTKFGHCFLPFAIILHLFSQLSLVKSSRVLFSLPRDCLSAPGLQLAAFVVQRLPRMWHTCLVCSIRFAFSDLLLTFRMAFLSFSRIPSLKRILVLSTSAVIHSFPIGFQVSVYCVAFCTLLPPFFDNESDFV